MKKTSKWPSRVLNLLVVLAMVISLSAILVAPPIAAAQETPCPRAIVYDGCHLDVAVATYVKDTDSNFIPQDIFNPPAEGQTCGDTFYVNAVVVNDGNVTAFANINATIELPGNVTLDIHESASKVWPGSQGATDLLPGRMADFWWKVCCSGEGLDQPITVTVTSGNGTGCSGSGTTHVDQIVTGVTKCLEIKIVEAPGLGPVTGRLLGNDSQPVVYDSGMPETLLPCQNFGIKAEITNLCDVPKPIGDAVIQFTQSTAQLVSDDSSWTVGTLYPGQTAVVAWTLHCEGPGDVNITVISTAAEDIVIQNPKTDSVVVHQKTPGQLEVVITQPAAQTSCSYSELPIKQATDQVPSCGASKFDVRATVSYTGAGGVDDVYAELTVSPSTGWVDLGGGHTFIRKSLGTLTVPQSVDFGNVTCIGEGLGNLTVRAYSLQDNPPDDATDVQAISQQKVIAKADPTIYEFGRYENICDPNGYDVSFRYYNWSGVEWPSQGINGNVTSCVEWGNGNVSLESVQWRKINSPLLVPPQNPDTWETLTFNNETEGQACVVIPQVICRCCAFDVRWHFKCTGNKPSSWVTFYGNVTVQEPAFTGGDTSEPICVIQEWKADLWTDILFFFQNENGQMIEQDGMVPGNDFHVVIPVMNTGDAAAYDVQVYFIITDIPAAGCNKSYTYTRASGDGDVSFNPITGVGVATFQYIPGHTAQKVVLLLHCVCEGSVRAEIPLDMPGGILGWTVNEPGMQALDDNTGEGVPVDDIHVPPCPMYFYQIPFTVTLENPITCQTFTKGDIFAVKALIHNGSQQDLLGVSATLSWNVGANVTLVDYQTPQTMKKVVGNITKLLDTEITWVLQCTDPGEVYLTVCAISATPQLSTCSDEVNVHQTVPPGACLDVNILSPSERQVGQDWDVGSKHAMIATGQQFAVTAQVENDGPNTATNVFVTIDPIGCDSLHYVTLVDDSTVVQGPYTIADGGQQIVTWTLWGGSDHEFWMQGCDVVNDTICVSATMSTDWACGGRTNATDSVDVSVYPAAFLVTSIGNVTPDTLSVGGLFTVPYRITNYGVADATSVLASLSVSPAGAAVIAQTPDNFPRTIAGWSFGSPYNYIEGNFTLRCMQNTPFTVTITPSGEDECGWHAVLGAQYAPWDDTSLAQYNWVQFALLPIQSRFLGPASVTLEPGVTGGIGCPDVTQATINLNSGWNLVSLPLIPDAGNGTVSVLFSGKPVDAIWGYSGGAPVNPTVMVDGQGYWVHMTAASTISYHGKVNPVPPQTPPYYTVAAGWNLIGFKSTCARTASAYLAGAPSWVRIWGFANNAWIPVQSGDMMQPGLGYWLAATGAGTIYP